VNSLRAFFNRRIPIWEGHTRDGLSAFIANIQQNKGNPVAIAQGIVTFLGEVAVGFSPTAFGNEFVSEIAAGCNARRRGKPAALQELGRCLFAQPDHHGVAAALRRLEALIGGDPAFGSIHIDLRHEFRDAIRLDEFEDCEDGLSEVSRRRTHTRPAPPLRAVSTIHKAKGLECDNVVVMPCDARHFRDTEASRCLLYVAMSRAMRSLTLVLSRKNACPLFII
jgi:DNA helicase-2/ATP-dependent DNA helicase PcrA